MEENRSTSRASQPALLSPEQCLQVLWKRIPRHIVVTFFAACVSGLLVHLFMLVNKLPNHDDIGHLFSATYGTASGRWLLPFFLKLDGQFSTPWLIGLLSILMLALAACFTVSTLRIRKPLGCVLTAAIMVSFPVISSTFTYMFSADAYFVSIALACFAAYMAGTHRFGFIGGCLALTLSMGIYQSYFGVAAVLMVGILIFDTLDNVLSLKALLLKGVKLVLTLGVSLVLYMVIVKLTTPPTGLVSYMGISDMGAIPLAQIPTLILRAYNEYISFFLRTSTTGMHFQFLRYLFALAALATLVLGALLIRTKKLPLVKILLLIVLAVLYPLAGNLVYVMVPTAPVHILMIYGMCFILLAPLALAEYDMALPQKARPAHAFLPPLRSLCCWIVVGTMALTAFSYSVYSNEAYLKIHVGYEQAYSHSTRLLSALEQIEGYTVDMPVVLVGTATEEVLPNPTPELDRINATGVFGMRSFLTSYTYGLFLQRYLGFPGQVFVAGTPQVETYAAMDEVAAMPSYPTSGSIAILEGMVVVKLSNPKTVT